VNIMRRALRTLAPRRVHRVAMMVALAAASVFVVGAARWWPSAENTPRRREIRMRGNSFAPREAHVAVGDTVIWVNGDIVRHNAVRRDLFDSGELRAGERFAWVPADTGLVRYQCTIHSRMRGTIRVTK
jgi:plastocyanin